MQSIQRRFRFLYVVDNSTVGDDSPSWISLALIQMAPHEQNPKTNVQTPKQSQEEKKTMAMPESSESSPQPPPPEVSSSTVTVTLTRRRRTRRIAVCTAVVGFLSTLVAVLAALAGVSTTTNGVRSNNAIFFVTAQTSLYRGLAGSTRRRGSGTGSNDSKESSTGEGLIDDIPTTILSNGVKLPLVGLGVGNLQSDIIETMIYEGMKSSNRLRLIDTAHASRNEKMVASGIVQGVNRFLQEQQENRQIQVHVVTKIWYTYLGYNRTKMAVDEILGELKEALNHPSVDLKIHLLLHWPQCFDNIEWMNCEEEEHNLPLAVKNAGPAPHLDRENAWKESWKALEDVYESHSFPIASIGVSNFEQHHIDYMVDPSSVVRILPHLTQINAWHIINNPTLVELYQRHDVHLQLYNVANGFGFGRMMDESSTPFPHAYHHLLMIANQLQQKQQQRQQQQLQSSSSLSSSDNESLLNSITPSQVILKYCLQKQYSTITRTRKLERLKENAALTISDENIPKMTDEQLDLTYQAMAVFMNQQVDLKPLHVEVQFHAKESDVFVYWLGGGNGGEGDEEERHIAHIEKGSTIIQKTYPSHRFKIYHAYDPSKFQTYEITKGYGETQHIHIDNIGDVDEL